MHTAICSFDNHAQAERAAERLLAAGFDRHDIHLQRRAAEGEAAPENDAWDALEREVAVDRSRVKAFGDFFGRLFGRDEHAEHSRTYSGAVERGCTVLVVDVDDEAEARRAHALMQELTAGDPNVIHRPTQPPVRELVGEPLPKQ